MLENFTNKKITIGDYTVDLHIAGKGPGLLLLHGFPETRFAWHKIAPHLTTTFTVVVPDLPGYGDSTGPLPGEYERYSKRSVGTIMVLLMRELGFDNFAVAGHDRGARVAYRVALDHAKEITKVAVLNIIPTVEVIERFNYEMALKMENWLFLAQSTPFPETIIQLNPSFYLNYILDSWSAKPELITPQARAAYLRCFKKPEAIAAICAEYRATGIDAEFDRQDRVDRRRIQCPVLVLWAQDDLGRFDPLAIWKHWADTVTGMALPGGHFLMEESPDEVLKEFLNFF